MSSFNTDVYNVLIAILEKKYKITYGYYIIVEGLVNVHVLGSYVVVNDNYLVPRDSSFIDFSSPSLSFIDDVLSAVQDRVRL